jgi:hypothetical protein
MTIAETVFLKGAAPAVTREVFAFLRMESLPFVGGFLGNRRPAGGRRSGRDICSQQWRVGRRRVFRVRLVESEDSQLPPTLHGHERFVDLAVGVPDPLDV